MLTTCAVLSQQVAFKIALLDLLRQKYVYVRVVRRVNCEIQGNLVLEHFQFIQGGGEKLDSPRGKINLARIFPVALRRV